MMHQCPCQSFYPGVMFMIYLEVMFCCIIFLGEQGTVKRACFQLPSCCIKISLTSLLLSPNIDIILSDMEVRIFWIGGNVCIDDNSLSVSVYGRSGWDNYDVEICFQSFY